MIYAVKGTKLLCKNTNITVREIRSVFRHSPCLICILVKKRKEGMAQLKSRNKIQEVIGYQGLEVINYR